ncbi:MAG: hypothetical protein UT05_C0001G0032 [Parcubacteria group bacterium GW2011_GWF2_38_76]|nr:MAG: hypothetical protein UT05_C0001G0032 [Parcubacteria group bacterium GW2011_GWF2_38_76]HBM45991.1 hypothetical protein [Patescibacteria group bacterium]
MKIFNKITIVTALTVAIVIGFGGPNVALAATAPDLGSIGSYGVTSHTFTNTTVGSTVNGDVCYTTGPATTPTITGATVSPCDPARETEQINALSVLNTQACTSIGTNVVLSGTYTPGCYESSGTMNITLGTTVTLNGAGVYIFKAGGALTTGANVNIVLTGGASASDVFWAPVGATTLGANNAFVGNIFRGTAAGLSITLGNASTLLGRLIAFGSTVTIDANTITIPTTLRVEKTVVNSTGTAVPSDFTLYVKSGGVDVAGSPAVGTSTPGTSYTLTAGTYVVSEDATSSYTSIFSGDCDENGSITLSLGDDKICTIINTDIALPAPVTPTPSVSKGGGYWNAPLPLINVTKIPKPLALPSGSGLVTYTYTATNVGKVPMRGVWVKDNLCNPVTYVSGDINKDSMLDLSESWVYSCTKTVSKTETNMATAHGQANGWDGYDTANATVVVGKSIIPPLIHVLKTPNIFVLPAGGGEVVYNYVVTNPGTAPLSNVSITDDKCTGLPGRVKGHPGDLNKNNLLESNESWSFTCKTNITTTTTNISTAVGYANGMIAIDISPATVAVAAPGLPNTGFGPDTMLSITNIVSMIIIAVLSFLLGQKTQKR